MKNQVHKIQLKRKSQGLKKSLLLTAALSLPFVLQINCALADITNTAQASGTYNAATILSNFSSAAVPVVDLVSSMSLLKTGVLNLGSNGRADAGDTITYSFTVTNTGPSTLHSVKVSDPLVNLASLPGQDRMVALLDASQQASDEITTASISQIVSETSAAADQYVATLTTSRSVPELAADIRATRKVVRMSGKTEKLMSGDKIGFVYALTNTGDGPLTGITVYQPDALAYGNTLDILAPNTSDSANIIFTRNITAAEIAAGEISAPAKITAKNRDTYFSRSVDDRLALNDIANFDDFASATISPSAVPTLAAGAATTFTANYVLKQTDIDQGFVDNTATATALNNVSQILTSVSSYHQPIVQVPGIAAIKTGQVNLGADNVASLGDVITYHFAITNTGNVTMSTVSLSDTNAAVAGTTIAKLLPSATDNSFTATHPLTQPDVDAAQVSNQAIVSGTPPIGSAITTPSDDDSLTGSDPTVVKLIAAPKIALLKTVFTVTDVNNNGMTDKDDTITYHFDVTNTGNQTLTNIVVTDPMVAVGDKNNNIPALPLSSLDPGQHDATYFVSVYTITQDDVDHGEVDNTAHVVGTAPGNVQVEDYSDPGVLTQDGPTKQVIAAKPVISLIKTERPVNPITDTNNNGIVDKDDVIHYTFRVENSGNVTLNNVHISDLLPSAIVQGANLPTLLPATFDDQTFTATYTITDDDVKAGRVSNQAKAISTSKQSGSEVTDFSDNADPGLNNPTITAIRPAPSIALKKTILSVVDTNNNGVTDKDDTITYGFSILNTGNLPLFNVSVSDAPLTIIGSPIAQLNAGVENTQRFKANYVLTNADIAAGHFSNTARVQGTPANGATVFDTSDDNSYLEDDPTVVYFAAKPSVALIKSFLNSDDADNSGTLNTGDTIHYKFTVINNGNEKLKTLTITDPNAIVTGGPLLELLPNATDTTTFTATHLITPADFTAGEVINQATVHAHADSLPSELTDKSDGASADGDTPTVTPLATVPGIALIKTVKKIDDTNGNGITDPDDIIIYAFDVVNTGNVDLNTVVLTDGNAVVPPGFDTLVSLPRGTHNTTAFTATHVVTIADAIIGNVTNSALVEANTPTATIVRDTSDKSSITGNASTVTPVSVPPAVFTKTANKSEVRRGETVTYTVTASNLLGTSYSVTDIMPPEFGFVVGSATVNGAPYAVTPVDRNIDFPSLTPVAGKITIKLKLLASTTLAGGKFVNNAKLINPATAALLATAQATVSIAIEAVFDCSDVIGHVFDDQNANGYMDDGEPGLPGVRVVTLNGVLITTDSEGRYHVPCAAVPDAKIGSNYLLKLDPRTLPTGYQLTTENPRDVRVTKGKVTKLNFGATIAHDVKLDLSAAAFEKGTSDLKTKWVSGVDKLVNVLRKKHASLKIVYHVKGEAPTLAAERVSAMQDTIIFAWENSSPAYDLNVTTSVEGDK